MTFAWGSSVAKGCDGTFSTNPSLQDRQLVEAFVDRIEIEPDAKQATVYLFADLETAYRNGFTRCPRGDLLVTTEVLLKSSR